MTRPVEEPILIVSLPRSGSSMVAGAFAEHGVWTGTCRPADALNPSGYFEHVGIGKLIGKTCGHRVHRGEWAPEWPGWRQRVEQEIRVDGYTKGPWLWKGSAVYWPLWHEFDPLWIVVHRDVAAITASSQEGGGYTPNARSLAAHLQAMEELVAEHDAVIVDADAVVRGDLRTLEAAIDYAGLEPDPDVLDAWIDPELWRHG